MTRGARVVSAASLKSFAAGIFGAAGLPAAQADVVADALVWADLRGIETHGVVRIPRYVQMLEEGAASARPDIRLVAESAATGLLDAGRALGPLAMTEGMAAAVRKARVAGAGVVAVRATTHTGALGYYTLAAARQGMAALAMAASWPNMAYHGARGAGVSTSGFSIAVPGGGRPPLVLDMAASVVSMGRLMQARRAGRALEPGWALDADGNPTTDAARAALPLPLGGPKGSGLALMVECLASLLAGDPIVSGYLEGLPGARRPRQSGLLIAIDVARFGDPAAFRREADRLALAIKALPRADHGIEILVPGERGARNEEERLREGIPVPQAVAAELDALALRLGAPPLAG